MASPGTDPGQGEAANLLESPPDFGALVQESSLSSDSLYDLYMTSQTSFCKISPQDQLILDPLSTERLHCTGRLSRLSIIRSHTREMHFNLHMFAKNK